MMNSPDRKSRKRIGSFTPRSSKVEISDLPNFIIQHILEFLPVKDAIIFCTLSRQWDSLWKSLANLSLHFESTQFEEVRRFASFVDKVLKVYASTKIKKFSLNFPYNRNHTHNFKLEEQIESWLRFATSHELEELCLDFNSKRWTNGSFRLPPFLYSSCPATKMSLGSIDLFEILESIYWTSLKTLSLTKVRCTSENIRAILLGSPSIECLTLRNSEFIDWEQVSTIDASCTSLKGLVVDCCTTNAKHMNILAPNLLSLTVVGYFGKIMLKLIDVSCLTEATINIKRNMHGVVANHEQKMLKGLLQKLTHLNKLIVGIWSLEVGYVNYFMLTCKYLLERKNSQAFCVYSLIVWYMSGSINYEARWRKIFTINLQNFRNGLGLVQGYIFGLLGLLVSCPNVEHLTINVITRKTCEASREHKIYSEMMQLKLEDLYGDRGFIEKKNPIRHLKNIKITGIVVGKCANSDGVLVKLVQHFLANANRLKKLIIHAEDSLTPEPKKSIKLLEIAETLLRFRRASPDAEVVFKRGFR